MPAHGTFITGSGVIFVTLSGTRANVNLWTELGSPTGVVSVVCTIAPGAIIYGSFSNQIALLIPADFAAGSKIQLVFEGSGGLYGAGGRGGDGGNASSRPGNDGARGGTALKTALPLTIDVTNGFIFGGGAGGKGGTGGSGLGFGGGGGGGGQGQVGGVKGTGGLGTVNNGADGHNGNFSGGGAGGASGGSDATAGANGKGWGGFTIGQQAQAFAVDTSGQGTGVLTWTGRTSTTVKGLVA